MSEKKKTYKGWVKSYLDLDEYLGNPCEIDEKLYLYVGECTPPKYISEGLSQGCDPIEHIDGIGYYITVSRVKNKYFYLGVLPEFKQ